MKRIPDYLKIIKEEKDCFVASTLEGEAEVLKSEIREVYLMHGIRSKKVKVSDLNLTEEFFSSRSVSYSVEHRALFVHSPTETIYQNGREVRKSRINDIDRFTMDLGLTTGFKVKKKFALFPTKMANGERVWFKTFFVLYGTFWGSSLHSGWSYGAILKSQSKKELGYHYLNLPTRRSPGGKRA